MYLERQRTVIWRSMKSFSVLWGGDELHRDLLNDYSEAALYRIRSEALIAFGIVFDEIILPAVIRESDSEDSPVKPKFVCKLVFS